MPNRINKHQEWDMLEEDGAFFIINNKTKGVLPLPCEHIDQAQYIVGAMNAAYNLGYKNAKEK